MIILIQRRADIAIRSLSTIERNQITSAFKELSESDRSRLLKNPKLQKLATRFSDRKLFVYKSSSKFRLILSFKDDICTIEDIVDHDRLDQLVFKQGQA
jgi:mRNA-degrading endonuclease RelE of RelBE toxin-antitoxin system